MIIDYLNLVGVAGVPTKDYPPLVVDPDGVTAFPFAFQRLQSIPRRLPKVANLRSIVQIEQLSTSHSYQSWWKPQNGFRSPIIKKVFRKSIGKGFNHGTMLSNLDNL